MCNYTLKNKISFQVNVVTRKCRAIRNLYFLHDWSFYTNKVKGLFKKAYYTFLGIVIMMQRIEIHGLMQSVTGVVKVHHLEIALSFHIVARCAKI